MCGLCVVDTSTNGFPAAADAAHPVHAVAKACEPLGFQRHAVDSRQRIDVEIHFPNFELPLARASF